MTARRIDIREAQPQLAELLELALAGTEVTIVEGDKPLARLVPVASPSGTRVAGLHRGAIQVGEDFDDPLPDGFWLGST